MLRFVSAVLKDGTKKAISSTLGNISCLGTNLLSQQIRCITAFAKPLEFQNGIAGLNNSILSNSLNKLLTPESQAPIVPCRTVTKFSLRKGKRASVKTVLKRFFRLHWGIWIRTKAGRHKHLWKKSAARKKRLRQHVFTNATQSHMLDKMVTSFWKRPKFYVDDPYAPYHTREEFLLTRRKPKPLPE